MNARRSNYYLALMKIKSFSFYGYIVLYQSVNASTCSVPTSDMTIGQNVFNLAMFDTQSKL